MKLCVLLTKRTSFFFFFFFLFLKREEDPLSSPCSLLWTSLSQRKTDTSLSFSPLSLSSLFHWETEAKWNTLKNVRLFLDQRVCKSSHASQVKREEESRRVREGRRRKIENHARGKKYQVQREFCLWLQSFFLLFLWTQKKRMKSLTPSSWLFKDKKPTLKEIPAEKTKLRRQSKWRKRHQRWYHQIQLLFLFLTSVFLESGSLYSHWHVHHIIIKSERDIRTMMMMVVEPKTGKGIFLDKV